MKISEVGKRGVVFSFDDFSTETYICPTNVYVIKGDNNIFICDTFLGPESMRGVKRYLQDHYIDKPIIIFNSHHDYDHHWGNCAFETEMIISHKLCKEIIEKQGESDLEKFKEWLRGDVKIVLPTVVFDQNYYFQEEGVYLFHTPGHTEDSSSCYDERDKILFVGDNIEEPIPYIRSNMDGVQKYVKSLENYLNYKFDTLIVGHGSIANKELLLQNLDYLKAFPKLNEPIDLEKNSKAFYMIHLQNLSTLADELAKDGNYDGAILYYNEVIDLGSQYDLINKEIEEKFREKINEIINQ
ncbi:MAG: MBL fold metallo-hydrolase [Candidatus Heimdallarchaeota archaeon]|nr:MBL fold metallo-hydrolase [Candidatus Heimdallarchaeota archaeon]